MIVKTIIYVAGIVLAALAARTLYAARYGSKAVPESMKTAGPEMYDAALEAGAEYGIQDVAILCKDGDKHSFVVAKDSGDVIVTERI